MRKSKKEPLDIVKEIASHILLIFVALVVLLPILYVVSAGFRVNQAIYGPLIDFNTWVDTREADRRANIIDKQKLLNRIDLIMDGKTSDEILDIELSKQKVVLEKNISPELQSVREKASVWIKSNGNSEKEKDLYLFLIFDGDFI